MSKYFPNLDLLSLPGINQHLSQIHIKWKYNPIKSYSLWGKHKSTVIKFDNSAQKSPGNVKNTEAGENLKQAYIPLKILVI